MILNTLGVLLILYLTKVVLWLILKFIAQFLKNEKLNKLLSKAGNSMLFGELIALYLQGFFEFLIAAILTIKKERH